MRKDILKVRLYNQFQSVYYVGKYAVVVDFLKNSVYKIICDKKDFIYQYSKEYEEIDKELSMRLLRKEKKTKIIKVTIVTDLFCNMNCLYCYEARMLEEKKSEKLKVSTLLAFLEKQCEKNENTQLQLELVGGEPFMPHNIPFLEELIACIRERALPVSLSVTTNGLNICDYIEEIRRWDIRDFQITIDGLGETHNRRRIPHDRSVNGFEKISKGIGCLLEENRFVSLRVNIDENNVKGIPELARYIIQSGWNLAALWPYIYPVTQSGSAEYKLDKSEYEILKMILAVLKEESQEIRKVFYLDFHGLDYLENILHGEIPKLRVTFCGVSNEQFVISNDGNIYSCWWGLGMEKFAIGYLDGRSEKLDDEKIECFKNRSVLLIDRCKKCKFKYICGGGCTYNEWVKHRSTTEGNCAEFDCIFNEYIEYKLEQIPEQAAIL